MRIGTLTIVALIASGPLAAQRLVTQPLDSAAHVRLHLFRGGRETGWLLAPFGPDSLVFRYSQFAPSARQFGTHRIERDASEVTRVDVKVGTHAASGFRKGAIWGGAAGAVLTVVLIAGMGGSPSTDGGYVAALLVGGVVVGATSGLVGAFIGSTIPRWSPAP